MLENNGYASIRQTQNAFFGGARIGCDKGSGLVLPDMLKVAQAYGFRTSEIKGHNRLVEAVGKVLAGDAPVFCVVRLGENEFAPKLSGRTRPDGVIASSSLEDMSPFLPEEMVRDNLITD